jgi:hypothetical protein
MDTKKGIFPINPTFITRLEDTDEFDLNNNGIFGEDVIQGFLVVVSEILL